MQNKVVLIALSAALLAGCGAKETSTTPAAVPAKAPKPVALGAPAETEAAPAPQAPAADAAPAVADASDPGAGLPEVKPSAEPLSKEQEMNLDVLSTALREFRNINMRFPNTMEELKTAGLIQDLPKPPTGKRFAIDQRNFRIVVADM
ncbi:MAG: hypothetical protein AB1705_05815 [Verrucomicrobiota bacterium]